MRANLNTRAKRASELKQKYDAEDLDSKDLKFVSIDFATALSEESELITYDLNNLEEEASVDADLPDLDVDFK